MIVPLDSPLTAIAGQPFMVRALLALLFIAPSCAMLGVHVISFRMSFFTHGISHSAFTGIALALIAGIATRSGMLAFGLIIAILLIQLLRTSNLSRDALIGVLLAIAVSFGVVVISMQKRLVQDFHNALYGDILSVDNADLAVMALVLLVTVLFEVLAFNRLTLIAVNEPMARSHGIHTRSWETLLALWVTVVILVGIEVIGLLMITSMLIVPAAAGRNLARNASGTLASAVGISLLSAILGLAFSYILDSATGATVVLTSAVLFLFTLPFAARATRKT